MGPTRKRVGGRATPATEAAARGGIAFEVLSYEHDPRAPAYGLEAVERLGLDPDRVLKTLVVTLGDRDLAVALVPVERELDLKALAAAAGFKRAVMADPKEAERATGYVVGGISPIGQRRVLPTSVTHGPAEADGRAPRGDRALTSAASETRSTTPSRGHAIPIA